ncbi:MAG: hypothetical protein JXK16_00330 [Thiotrichales bacterium]|nr:hypothetical protein [Thiotrichales bacterium]
MKVITKLLLIAFLIIVNAYLVSSVELVKTDVKQFFPDENTSQHNNLNIEKSQYLFVSTNDPEPLYDLESQKLIDGVINVVDKSDVFLVFFNEDAHNQVIDDLTSSSIMGTSIVGSLLSDEFISDVQTFLVVFIPIMIPLLAFFTSVKFVLNTIGEVLFYSAFVVSIIVFFEIALNSAYLLSLLFSYIYIFTLINQVYYNRVATYSLVMSLSASLVTTGLSAFLLYYSGFGVISDFGKSLMIWVLVLAIYLSFRLLVRVRMPHALDWFKMRAPLFKVKSVLQLIVLFTLSFVLLILYSPVNVNLNPLGMSSYQSEIKSFESKSSLSQPILLTIQSKDCSLRNLKCNQQLSTFVSEIERKIEIKFQPILDLNTLYQSFTEESFEGVTPAKFAQFKLGLDMMSVDRYLYGSSQNTANYIAAVSLLEPVDDLIELKRSIESLNNEQSLFTVELEGHLSKIASYQTIFLNEMFWSVLSMLTLLATLFLIGYRKFAVLVSLLPAVLAISVLFFMHSLFKIDLSVMTLIAIILFVGLITDNVIHILMTYRMDNVDCFQTVFKPIILSNVFLILSMALMGLVNDGFMKVFGIELAILLSAHLLFLIYFVPTLFSKLMPRNN